MRFVLALLADIANGLFGALFAGWLVGTEYTLFVVALLLSLNTLL